MLTGFIVLLIFQLLGELLIQWLQLPIPGPVAGMFLLFFYLLITGGPGKGLVATSESLIRYLALFFLPAGVGIFFLGSKLSGQWEAIIAASLLGTVVAMIFTGLVMKFLIRSNSTGSKSMSSKPKASNKGP